MKGATVEVQIVSRRVIRPEPATSPDGGPPEPEIMHLTPWDLRMIAVDYIQKGVLLPKPQTGGEAAHLVDSLASSFARALDRFYPLAGRLTVAEATDGGVPGPGIVVSLCCNGEGAEFVHAVAPEVTVGDITAPVYIPSVVWSLFPLNGALGTDVSLPVLAAQVTELADGVFVAMSLNHGVADGTTFWHFFSTWSEISRSGSSDAGGELSTPPPVLERWFLETSSVPITLPFGKLEDIVRRPEYPPVQECFFNFSAESVRKLKARANAEMAGTATATSTISSLQSLLAHTWRAVCRARELAPERETTYFLLVGCRGRVKGIPRDYVGNSVASAVARWTAGEVVEKGLGWAAWLLNRAVASFDEATVRDNLASWPQDPKFLYVKPPGEAAAAIMTGSSPRFDVYGNDFGWGRPVAVRSGAGNKTDGKVTVYAGRGGAGSMALEVCLEPEVLARLVADEEFMEAVSAAATA
ncbi:hypothetical protein SETIT_6G011800v2 [Setaria italica]|uniref:Acetyltransferase n=1 Tax=Setaria italica TaxID=4555 RepID=K3YHG8_SETIT|nr:uncharacterized acetyltransferase At3g50280 [Setaria italica]RCV29414.1 hypothetical protein SETIT_6G011800v2 [Setaria italica]